MLSSASVSEGGNERSPDFDSDDRRTQMLVSFFKFVAGPNKALVIHENNIINFFGMYFAMPQGSHRSDATSSPEKIERPPLPNNPRSNGTR
jgi:hypothetical protein